MDPLSALSVASSVISFVDFGSKLVSQFNEIKGTYNGEPPTVVRLKSFSNDLSSVAADAQNRVKEFGSSYPRASQALARLNDECVEAEVQLGRFLDKMTAKTQGNRLRNLEANGRAAFRAIWSEKQVEEWREKLERIRNQIMMNVLMCLWDEGKKTRELAEGIDGGIGALIDVVGRIELTMHSLQDDFKKISDGGHLTDPSGQTRLEDAIWESTGFLDVTDDTHGQKSPPLPIAANLEATSKKILDTLRFEGMTGRHEQIATTYPATFEWLFQTGDFTKWLQSENKEVFWVTGKPASGKSTLIKFISTHPSLRQHLQSWAGDSQLYVASFYLWSAGSKSQKSRVGLLRSLLYQLLSQKPELCHVVSPRRQLFYDLAGQNAAPPAWQWKELRDCLVRFAFSIQGKGRLALFIDGLDEYDGNHEEFVAFLKHLHLQCQPKLCVSSRPWNIFSDEFRSSPSLRMELLTKSDIDIYIEGRLGGNISIQELRQAEPKDMRALMKEIRDKAEGIFLWVVLVVEQLLEVTRDHPHMSAIWEVLNSLPQGLEELYEAIQRTVSPSNLEMASKLYQLVMEWKRTWNGQIGAIFLWFALDCMDPLQQMSYPNRSKERVLLPLVTRTLAGNTKGILQVSTSDNALCPPTVDFLHRTAFDWIRMETNWSKICSQGPQNYQPTVNLVIALVNHLRSLGPAPLNHDQVRVEYIFRVLKISGDIQNTPENRAYIAIILDQIELDHLLPPHLAPFFAETEIPTNNRQVLHGLLTLAAGFCCLTYLQAKADALPETGSPHYRNYKGKSAFKSLFTRDIPPISLLEASVFGMTRNAAHGLALEGADENITRHGLKERNDVTPWHISRRLDTVEFLLTQQLKPSSYLKNQIKSRVKQSSITGLRTTPEDRYWFLVAKLFKHYSDSNYMNRIKHEILPDIEYSRLENEFPDLTIGHNNAYAMRREYDLGRPSDPENAFSILF
ncbi:hypothetical protein N7456_003515 [Penicillium angulare]|uniref:Nephrocystin 3-like N-terminal domain-containing protein n=1 Tax=Penicillium angulare TaxID=116970 RepID=A0A9W9FUT0_9EURO|nr:hypothetical protein N7456_003515 [Penicillium angulare]